MIEKEELNLFEERWKEIDQNGFIKVLQSSKSQLKPIKYEIDKQEFLTIYTKVHDILMTKNIEIRKLCHQRLVSTLKYHCIDLLKNIRSETLATDFASQWNSYTSIVTSWILKTFCYMKRIKQLAPKNSSLEEEIKTLFKQEIYDKMAQQLKESLMKFITQTREPIHGEVNYDLLKSYIDFALYFKENENDSLYIIEYEKMLIDEMKKHYQNIISQHITESYIEYLQFSLNLIESEETNANKYLPQSTVQIMSDNLFYLFFFQRAKQILELPDGFISLLEKQNSDLLKKTFDIYSKNDHTLNIVLGLFKQFITKQFELFVQQYSNIIGGPQEIGVQTNFIKDYLSFQLYIMNLITTCFANNNLFNVAFKEILEGIQSKNENYNISYILPFYYDKYLRRSSGWFNGTNYTNDIIDQSILIFPFVYEKDVFITIHRNLLSNRLLTEDIVSMDSEKYLIGKLKSQCGEGYTSNVETMISDYFFNKEITHKYRQWLEQLDTKTVLEKINSTYIVLTAENWPSLNISKLSLPNELLVMSNRFAMYYHQEQGMKTLQWALFDSTMEIEGQYGTMAYTFTMNTAQGLILLCFNPTKGYKHNRDILINKIGFEKEADFDKSIIPFIQNNIIAETYKNEILAYELNKEFMSNKKRIKILLSTKGEEIIKKEKIEDDRSMAIDGTIVRLMKAQKQLSHNELVRLVLEHLDKFKIQIATIKKRIDSLIEKEMIIRDKNDPNIYIYLANNN